MNRWVDEDSPDLQQLLSMRESGLSLSQMAEHFGITRQMVSFVLNRRGQSTKDPPGLLRPGVVVAMIGCAPQWVIRHGRATTTRGKQETRFYSKAEAQRLKKLYALVETRLCLQCGTKIKVHVHQPGGCRTLCSEECAQARRKGRLRVTVKDGVQLKSQWLLRLYKARQTSSKPFGYPLRRIEAIKASGMTFMQFRHAVNRGLIRSREAPEDGYRQGVPYRRYSSQDVSLALACKPGTTGG